MTSVPETLAESPRWKAVADQLERDCSSPSPEQLRVAKAVGTDLPGNIPTTVAAVLLRTDLAAALHAEKDQPSEVPEALNELEEELGLPSLSHLLIGTRAEVSAWFEARYMLKSARGLREVEPGLGDVVTCAGWPTEQRVVSSIGDDGCVYMKGLPHRRAWPHNIKVLQRVGDPGHADAVGAVKADLLNRRNYASNFDALQPLKGFQLDRIVPTDEAVRALEELLESGERKEEPFQALLASQPALLAAVVAGNWGTYVLPKPRLGSELVPDFLVLGLSSLGAQWVLVELEAARHKVLLGNGELSKETRHAVKQVRDWREWLTKNISYAHAELNLYGITSRAPGLVIIGRDDPQLERSASRASLEEDSQISIHSWDWVLRNAVALTKRSYHLSDFALRNAASE